MTPCEPVRNLLFDHLYGLLDEAEAQTVREHVALCPICEAQLEQARSQQQLFARAAQVIRQVPEFQFPDERVAATEPVAMPVTPATPAVDTSAPAGRRWSWKHLMAYSLALCLLLMGGGYYGHQNNVASYEASVRAQRKKLEEIDAQFEIAKKNVATDSQRVAAAGVHMQLAGPGQVHTDAPTLYRVALRDLAGKPHAGNVQVQLVDAASQRPIYTDSFFCAGEGAFTLPGGVIGDAKAFALTVKTAGLHPTQITEKLGRAETSQRAHLVLNKSTYSVGELAFFRALVLERYSLKPPSAPIQVRFVLKDLQGRVHWQQNGATGEGGIVAGEWALTDELASGLYQFEVLASDGSLMQSAQRQIEIVRPGTPVFAQDRAGNMTQSRAGDTLKLRAMTADGNPLANKRVTAQQIYPSSAAPAGNTASSQQQLLTDSKGNLSLNLSKLESNRAVVEFQVEKEKRIVQVPVQPTQLAIDFYPEGGELIAGVPTRVYYRVRTPQGEPIDPAGRVIILSKEDVLLDSERGQGAGVFTFTPQLNESYTVRFTDPVVTIRDPFKKIGIHDQGLALRVNNSVASAGEPLEITLTREQSAERVFLLATCRGQIVAQQAVDLKPGANPLQLPLIEGCAGLVRVTVYDYSTLQPLAERLVFRNPTRRLEVVAGTDQGKLTPQAAGQKKVELEVMGLNEEGLATPFWALANVTDTRAAAEGERGLDVHFYLAGDVQSGEELDDAFVLLNDQPASRQALDLFLGTQGWRRFVPTEKTLALARVVERDAVRATNSMTFISAENAPMAKLRQQAAAQAQANIDQIWSHFKSQETTLTQDRVGAISALRLAQRDLAQQLEWPDRMLRGLGSLLSMGLLVVGAGLLLMGLIRRILSRPVSGVLSGSFLCMGLCLAMYYLTTQMPDPTETQQPAIPGWASLPRPTAANGKQSNERAEMEGPVGLFALVSPPMAASQPTPPAYDLLAQITRQAEQQNAQQMLQNGFGNNLSGGGYGGAFRGQNNADGKNQQYDDELRRRFLDAAQRRDLAGGLGGGGTGGGGQPSATVANPAPGGTKNDSKKGEQKALDEQAKEGAASAKADKAKKASFSDAAREYAFRRAATQGEGPDTVLWAPVLFAEHGQTLATFDLPAAPAQYRVQVFANTPDGRVGYFEGVLQAK